MPKEHSFIQQHWKSFWQKSWKDAPTVRLAVAFFSQSAIWLGSAVGMVNSSISWPGSQLQ
jgi:hypothetical protein